MKILFASTRINCFAFVVMTISSLSSCTKTTIDPEPHQLEEVHINHQVPKPVEAINDSSDGDQPVIEPQPRKIP